MPMTKTRTPGACISLALALASACALTASCAPIHVVPWAAGEPAVAAEVADTPVVVPLDPAATFAALEERMLAAATIEVAVEIESTAPFVSTLTGTLKLWTGNQLELSIDGQLGGEPVKLRLAAASGHLKGSFNETVPPFDVATPIALNEAVIVGLQGMGLMHNLAVLKGGLPPDHSDGGVRQWLSTANHIWDTGRDATLFGRPARALVYDVVVDGKDAADATLWLDAETGLPVKREVRVRMDETENAPVMTVVETYLKFAVTP